MNRTILRALIAILVVVDLVLAVLVFMPFQKKEQNTMLQATEAFAPAEPQTEAQPTEATTLPTETLPPETLPPETTLPAPETFALTFAGDCTLGADPDIYYAKLGFIKTVGDDMGYPFRNVVQYFEDDDFTFVNLEGVLADRGNPIPKAYNFRGPTHYTQILTEGSVEAVSLANNHTGDYGAKGYTSTVEALESAGIPYLEEEQTLLFTTERGLKIGLYGMVYYDLNEAKMIAGIASLKEQGAQLIIVAPHWGLEGEYAQTDEQTALGHAAIDAGAHIVVGTHPHVLQPIEEYNGGIIYYSLGNFAFGGNGAPGDMDSVIIRQEVLLQGDGTVTLGEMTATPVCVSSVPDKNNYQPTPYGEGTEEFDRVMAKLAGTWE